MHKFPIYEYKRFADLPLDKFNSFKFSVYLIDFEWKYLFVNQFVHQNLGDIGKDLVGKNMWKEFPVLGSDPVFNSLREKMESRTPCSLETHSPLNGKRLHITGYPLEDCFYFSSSILPDRQELINDLRSQLKKSIGP